MATPTFAENRRVTNATAEPRPTSRAVNFVVVAASHDRSRRAARRHMMVSDS